ncbi:GTP cyclohydrolase II RibA [Nocardia sp. NPDC127526]|uniref:GTP cyclohydrolase II RibA n=1 Tax=Nocardia sp. NPDC127526 TaxID=3345393 RepID=UPI0036286F38
MELRTDPAGSTGPVLGHVLVFGNATDDCLVRIHSRCLYGDALQSDDCDCGPELDLAMDMIQAETTGVLIYLEQEGRGSGLIVKAMGLQLVARTGVDTFTSYRLLGHPIDSRSYEHAAAALSRLGLRAVRLLTNNPDKVRALREAGLRVRAVPLQTTPRSERAREYMESKHRVRGHHLPVSQSRLAARAVRAGWQMVRNAGWSGTTRVARDTAVNLWLR